MTIEKEVLAARKKVVTDGYDMSVGELVSLFEKDELKIDPEYQRLFRWEHSQKTRFIESLLLGIPTPPIFVSTQDDGTWELVDGLQRVSTLLEFFGVLRDQNGDLKESLELGGTELIPSLGGVRWDSKDERSLPVQLRLDLKRVRVRIEILKRESDTDTKFELFQRLNTGGTKLEPQEVRNCVMVMLNPEFFTWLRELSEMLHFQNTVSISKNKQTAMYGMELVLRTLALRHLEYAKGRDVHDYLDEAARRLPGVLDGERRKQERKLFVRAFEVFEESRGTKSFRVKGGGSFSLASYEVLSVGLIDYVSKHGGSTSKLVEVVRKAEKNLWNSAEFKKYSGMGVRGSDRLFHLGARSPSFFA